MNDGGKMDGGGVMRGSEGLAGESPELQEVLSFSVGRSNGGSRKMIES